MDVNEATPIFAHRVDAIDDQLGTIQRRIHERAYQRFLSRGSSHGDDLGVWIAAESELLLKPDMSIHEQEDEVIVEARFTNGHWEDHGLFVTTNEALLTSSCAEHGQVFVHFQFPHAIEFDSIDASRLTEPGE